MEKNDGRNCFLIGFVTAFSLRVPYSFEYYTFCFVNEHCNVYAENLSGEE